MTSIYSMILFFAVAANAATIAELIAERKSTMSRANAAIASNPEWSQPGAHTLFISRDAGFQGSNIPSGSLGSLMIASSLDFLATQNYQILRDVKSPNIMVYDNYRGGQAVPEIHCRFGTGEAMAVQQIKADNGWLYILDKPIEPPGPADIATRSIGQRSGPGASKFFALANSLGLNNILSLRDVTMWIPTDPAMDRLDARGYTQDQLRSIVMYHITPAVRYSTQFNNGPIPSLLDGQTINVALGSDSLTLNGNSAIFPADTFATTGVIHLIGEALIPPAIPAVFQPPAVLVSITPATTPATGTTPTRSTGTSATDTSATDTASSQGGTISPTPTQRATSDAESTTKLLFGTVLGFLIYVIV